MTLPDPTAWPVDPATLDELLDGPSADLLRRRANVTPDATALVDADTGDQTTYGELDATVDDLASDLMGTAGETPRVGLFLDTRPAFARTYFAVARLGGVAVPLNRQLTDDRLTDQVARATVDLLVCDGSAAERAFEIAPAGVPVASVDTLGEDGIRRLSAPEAGQFANQTVEPAAVPPDGDRVVMFTSGTTGDPKGVRLTRGNLVASAVGSADRLGVDPDDRWLVCLPMYHMGGLAPLVRSTLYGTTTVIQRDFDAETTAQITAEYDVTGVSLVPTMLTRLLDAGWEPTEDLRFVLLGGAPVSTELVERAVDHGVPVYPTYGTTETASQIATATPREALDHPGTVGRPLSVTDVSVVTDDGGPLDAGERGELVVDGPTVTPGYLDDERATPFGPDGFHTGDLGYCDEEGRLWVVGRLDDRILTGGENVYPDRVVEALCAHDDVADVAVVGLPDDEWGELVAALVVPADESLTRDGFLDHARDELADFAVPKTIDFTDALPRTSSGTVDREAVRKRLRNDDGYSRI